MLQRDAVCCSVLQCVAVRCVCFGVLQRVASFDHLALAWVFKFSFLRARACACEYVCARAYVCMCVCVRVCAWVCFGVCTYIQGGEDS